jgi:hypothetical protein
VAGMATTNSTATLRKSAFMIDILVVKLHETKQQSTHQTQFIP